MCFFTMTVPVLQRQALSTGAGAIDIVNEMFMLCDITYYSRADVVSREFEPFQGYWGPFLPGKVQKVVCG